MRHKLPPPKYRQLKIAVYERDRFCRLCGQPNHLSPHHIISRGMGGGDFMGNLITLCIMKNDGSEPCHQLVEKGAKRIPERILQEIGYNDLIYQDRMQSEGGND